MPKRLECNGCGTNLKRADSIEVKADRLRERTGVSRDRLEGLEAIRKDISLSP